MTRKAWLWITQLLLLGMVGWFVARAVTRHWAQFRSLDVPLDLDPVKLLAAGAIVLVTYAVLIEAWRRVLLGWGEKLAFRDAARIWCLSNLGRYVPGKVWSLAGLTVLAQRAGVTGWAAAGGALAMQALAVGTGAGIAAVTIPGAVSSLQLVIAALAGGGAIAAIVWSRIGATVARFVKPSVDFRALPVSTAAVAAGITLVSWVSYGTAFWLLAKGMFSVSEVPLRTAVGVFAGGYIVGLLALFAPGGVGVRELIFVTLLAPTMGTGGALALSVGSRLLLTVTEVGSAVGAFALTRGASLEKDAVDAQGS